MGTVCETPFLFVHADPCEEVGGVEQEHRLNRNVHGGLHDGLVHGVVHLLPDLLDLRGLRVVLDPRLLEAVTHEGRGERPHGGVIVRVRVGLGDTNARVVLPLFQSLLVAKEAHDQATGVLLFFPSRGRRGARTPPGRRGGEKLGFFPAAAVR